MLADPEGNEFCVERGVTGAGRRHLADGAAPHPASRAGKDPLMRVTTG